MVAFGAPPVEGLGSTGGFKLQVQDRGDAGFEALQGAADNVIRGGDAQPGLVGLFSSFVMAVTIAFVGGRPAMISAATGAIAPEITLSSRATVAFSLFRAIALLRIVATENRVRCTLAHLRILAYVHGPPPSTQNVTCRRIEENPPTGSRSFRLS